MQAASWRKRLGARFPPLGSRVVPSSCLGHSVWVSWWTKRGLGRFFSGFPPFSPTISPHSSHPFRFISFHQPLWWCIRRGRPASLLFTGLKYRGFIASHPSTRPCVGHELRIFIYIHIHAIGGLNFIVSPENVFFVLFTSYCLYHKK